MKMTFRLPFQVVSTKVAHEIDRARQTALSDIKQQRSDFDTQVQKAIHGAYAGIVCAVCGKNVFRGEGTWVHGNGGKAYCLDPCWKDKSNVELPPNNQNLSKGEAA